MCNALAHIISGLYYMKLVEMYLQIPPNKEKLPEHKFLSYSDLRTRITKRTREDSNIQPSDPKSATRKTQVPNNQKLVKFQKSH